MILRLIVLAALLSAAATVPAATVASGDPGAAVPPVIEFGARIVAARAVEARAAGRPAMAEAFDDVARALRRGEVSLEQAEVLVRLGGVAEIRADARVAVPAASGAFRAEPIPARPAVTAEHATAVLDGDLPPPEAAPVPAGPVDLVTTVLAVRKSDVGKPARLMIDGGTNKGVAAGQEFAIRRDGKTLVKVTVEAVKDSMSVCAIVPGSWADEQADVREGDEAASLPR